MSTLARFRRPGGFKQLLTLVETSATKKQNQLLTVVGQEDSRWAAELKKRLLTIDKILSWDAQQIDLIFSHLPEKIWLTALGHIPKETRVELVKKITQVQTHTRQRQIADLHETLTPTVGEIEAAQGIVVKKVRELQASGEFRPERIDPNLAVDGLDRLAI